jgi:hypothetical protein
MLVDGFEYLLFGITFFHFEISIGSSLLEISSMLWFRILVKGCLPIFCFVITARLILVAPLGFGCYLEAYLTIEATYINFPL